MSHNQANLVIGRPLLLRPFTSVKTEECGKAPKFSYLCVGRHGDVNAIDVDLATWPEERFVYIFLSGSNLPSGETLTTCMIHMAMLAGVANPLLGVVRVAPDGTQAVLQGELARTAASQETLEFQPMSTFEWAGLEPNDTLEDSTGNYAIASPILLPLEAIEALEAGCPTGVPDFGLGMGVAVHGPYGEIPFNPLWVFPVVDPIYITQSLTQKYEDACDAYWSLTRVYDPETRVWGGPSVDVAKKGVADALVSMRTGLGKLDGVASGQPDAFIEEYRRKEAALWTDREAAALTLLQWLETDIVKQADTWPRDVDGVPGPNYACYLDPIALAHARLHESDTGLTYLTAALDASQRNAGKPGPLRVVEEFILPTERKTEEHVKSVLKCGNSIVSSWAAFLVAIEIQVASRTTTVFLRGVETVRVTEFADAIEMALVPLNVWFAEGSNRFVVNYTEVERKIPVPVVVEKQVSIIIATEVQVPLSSQLQTRLEKANLAKNHANALFATINLGLTFFAMREAFAKQGNSLGKVGSVADFASAILGSADDSITGARVLALARRLQGAANLTDEMAKVSSARLGFAAAIFSAVNAGTSTAEKYAAGDWDAAAAQTVQGVGSVISAAGYWMLWHSPESGTLAPWLVAGGTAVSFAGLLWSFWADDTTVEQWIKFSALGQLPGKDVAAPDWALCPNGTFADWNPNTLTGIALQLQAAKQLQFSFAAQWNDTQPNPNVASAYLRIVPGSLRGDSVLHIEYEATWDTPFNAAQTDHAKRGYCRVSLGVDGAASWVGMRDFSGYFNEANAVHLDASAAQPTIDVNFELTAKARAAMLGDSALDATTTRKHPIALRDFKCFIRLDVNGDGSIEQCGGDATLIVPSNHAGGRRVQLKLIENGNRQSASASSLNSAATTDSR